MGCAKGVVDVQLAQRGQLLGKGRVVALFLGVKARVFEQKDVSGLSCQDGSLQLGLLPEIHELATDLIKAEIMRALEQKLEVSLQLVLVAVASLTGQTPLQARVLRQRQERLAAIDAIREDRTVKKLQHAFAAELDEASVVKIENNSGEVS